MKKLFGLLCCLPLVVMGAVYQNSFVTDPVGNPLGTGTPELANFATKTGSTNAAIGVIGIFNIITNGWNGPPLLINSTTHFYSKLYSENNFYSITNWLDNVTATNVTIPAVGALTNLSIGSTKVVITDANGKEVGATLANMTLVGTTLTALGGGGGAYQTNWLQDINGNGFQLTNLGGMSITGTLSTATLVVTNPDSSIWIQSSSGTGTNITLRGDTVITNIDASNINANGLTVVGAGSSLKPVLSLTNTSSATTAIKMFGSGAESDIATTSGGLIFYGPPGPPATLLQLYTNAATFPAPALSTSSSTNDPAQNEFPVAGWVRGLFNNGILDYASANTAIGFTNADSANQVVYMFTNAIPPSSTRVWASAFLTNNGYVGSVTTTNRFTFISGPAVVNAYLGLSSGGGDALSVNPELYYSYDGTNWVGDYDCQPQALTAGRTNLYQFVITFPSITATNSTGFFVERRLKVRSVGGTPTMYFMVGTNIVSGTNNASHISFSGPSSVNSGAILKASGYGTNTTLYGSAVGTNAVYIDATGETLSNALGAVFISSGSIKATNTAATTWFKSPTNSPTDGQVLTASGAAADTKWATASAGPGGGGTNSGPIALAYDGTIVTNVAVLATTPVGCVTNAPLPYRLTLTTNALFQNPTGTIQDGQVIRFELIQDATGNRVGYWDTKFSFGTDITAITLTTNASKRDFVTFIYSTTPDKWFCTGFLRGY